MRGEVWRGVYLYIKNFSNILLEQPLPSLLPFVPILKGGEDETIIREALRLLKADEQLNQLETVLAFFATFVLDSALVQEIIR